MAVAKREPRADVKLQVTTLGQGRWIGSPGARDITEAQAEPFSQVLEPGINTSTLDRLRPKEERIGRHIPPAR
jgi:hypothetical protein